MKLLASLAVLVGATIGAANASPLQYSTDGSFFTGNFTTGTGTTTVTVNGITPGDVATLKYVGPNLATQPVGNGTVSVSTPTNISYGFIQESFVGAPADGINLPAFTFTLTINNLTAGTTNNFIGTALASTVTTSSNTLNISWSPQPLLDGGAFFTINTPTSIPTDNTLAGQASLQGAVTNAVPEPGSLFLLGAGFIGLGFSARKKFISRS